MVIASRPYRIALLLAALAFFAVLALDIAVPASILSVMALMRWAIAPAFMPGMEGGAA